MTFRRLIASGGLCLSLAACLPGGFTPAGSPDRPVGATAPDASPAAKTDEEGIKTGPDGTDFGPGSGDSPNAPGSGGGDAPPPPPPPPPGSAGGGQPADWRERSRQLAMGGGFCPKPDEATLDDFPQARDWRAFHGAGSWWEELSKTEPVSRWVGKDKPFDLYFNVQAYYVTHLCEYGWKEPIERGAVTVRLIFRPAARNLEFSSHVDAPVTEMKDGYNVAFKGLTASDGLIDVYVHVGGLKDDSTFTAPPADDAAFVADPGSRFVGSFATKVSIVETIRGQKQIPAFSR